MERFSPSWSVAITTHKTCGLRVPISFRPTYESPYIYLTSLKSLAYREDGEVLAVVERGDNHTKDLWAARANRLLATLPAELEQFWPAPTGLLTAASGASGPFRIFRGAVAVAELSISPTAVAFDRGGRKVAAASPGGSIWVTDFATAKSTEIKGAGSGVSALADRKSTRLNSSHLVISY